ncbi:small GTP-binding protein [Bacillus pakistanensis]|uniref:Small GTP-binding protein n=1 Tax=Rossellomorea pakistanensis TaxID=992288 RepID=A0ABS2N8V2_9BACI|nr:dynamin family protein [Bacillus pakistanensis]MBM7584283.1 small GTP-binding protein [Bacillus pakistanensis]
MSTKNVTKRIETNEQALHTLASLYKEFLKKGDIETVKKAEILARKMWKNEFIVAFCGHFSAGKSTMINSLIGENVLPSSPIPTSANTVKVHRSVTDFTKVFYHDKAPVLFPEDYDFEIVKDFCKDGQNVHSIEIGHKDSALPEGVTVMDTPGVDSTDEAHKISTESALHVADIVFYVMDYNHVQSQLNFQYTKELLSHGVKLYLIVNQVDKHNEEELSFESFKNSVKKSFESWNVNPEGIYYTTLKKEDDPHNQLLEVKSLISGSLDNKTEMILNTYQSGIDQLLAQHQKWLEQELEEVRAEAESIIDKQDWENKDELIQQEISLKEAIEQHNPDRYLTGFKKEIEKVLKNAYLMPFETRELAKSYLESQERNFKVGLFFSKKKTEEVRETRFHSFMNQLKEGVTSQLEWHLKSKGNEYIKKSGVDDPDVLQNLENIRIEVNENVIQKPMKQGANVTGEYVLNYCEELATNLKRMAKVQTDIWVETWMEALRLQSKEESQDLEEKYEIIKPKVEWFYKLDSLETEQQEHLRVLYLKLKKHNLDQEEIITQWQKEWNQDANNVSIFSGELKKQEKALSIENVIEQERINDTDSQNVEDMVKKLNQMSSKFKEIRGFSQLANQLKLKAERLGNQEFTIALFGAFSAGKSSFANALLGEKVLPVSPNPTTAAINRIRPTKGNKNHGSAEVHLKSGVQMLEDIKNSLKLFGHSCNTMQEAYEMIPSVLSSGVGEGKEKVHLSFLNAFYKGFDRFHSLLGQTVTTDLTDFKEFVANETQSCFVESIDLYYDCEITRRGITLVDTPGADSINARHTGVSFEYIRNSDAILFVTYYNHAFAKADREFLIQLGRVKDSFELDKMFFIINAIDLAENEEEYQEVKMYVHEQLTQYGIRFPKLFGVSSLLAIKHSSELKEDLSGMDKFKQEFHSFLQNDLTSMAIESAQSQWEKGLKRLQNLIEVSSEDEFTRQKKKETLKDAQSKIFELLSTQVESNSKKRISQEIQELLFYVKQRVFLRFSDFFKESFHPSMFQGKGSTKDHLQKSLNELLESIGFDFSQEMRATSLRVERFSLEQLKKEMSQLEKKITKIYEGIVIPPYEFGKLDTLPFEKAFEKIELMKFQKAWTYFKNEKHFFESDGKKKVMEELYDHLQHPSDLYLERQQERMEQWFVHYVENEMTSLRKEMLNVCQEQFSSWEEALNSSINIDDWKESYRFLKES